MSSPFSDLLSHLHHSIRSYATRSLIFERDDPVTSLFRVESGEVHLLRRQLDGAEFILQRAAAGDVLAEASLSTSSYHCAATAVIATKLAVFSRDEVLGLIADDPHVAKTYTAHLAAEVRVARMRAEIVTLRRVADRLDAWLVWHDGVLPGKGDWHVLAREIGVSNEALYRELARRR